MSFPIFERIASFFRGSSRPNDRIESPYVPRNLAVRLSVEDKAAELVKLVETEREVTLLTRSQHFEDFKKDLEALYENGLSEEGWGALRHLVAQHVVEVETLKATAELIRQFQRLNPRPAEFLEFREAVTIPIQDEAARDRLFAALSGLVSSRAKGLPVIRDTSELLELCRSASDVLLETWQSEFPSQNRPELLTVMNAMARHQHSLQGVESVKQALQTTPDQGSREVVVNALCAGLEARESPNSIVAELRLLKQQIARYPEGQATLLKALEHQASGKRRVVPLLKSATQILYQSERNSDWPSPGEYFDLLDTMLKAGAQVDRLTSKDVESFKRVPRAEYFRDLSEHVQGIKEIKQVGASSGVLSHAAIRVLDDLEALGPNQSALNAFRYLIYEIGKTAISPSSVLVQMGELLNSCDCSPSDWDALRKLLKLQIERISPVDEVIANCIAVKRQQESERLGSEFFQDYCQFCEMLSPEVTDFQFLTPGAYDHFYANPTADSLQDISWAAQIAKNISWYGVGKIPEPSSLISVLLSGEGLVRLLKTAVEAQDSLNLSSLGIYQSVPVIVANLSIRGQQILGESLDYQIEHGFSSEELFQNFASFAESFDIGLTSEQQQDCWDAISDLFGGLRSAGVTLGCINAGAVREYIDAENKPEVLRRYVRYSEVVDAYRTDPGVISSSRSGVNRLVGSLGTIGANSCAVEVIENLLKSATGANQLTVSEIADACGPKLPGEAAWKAVGSFLDQYRAEGYSVRELFHQIVEIDSYSESSPGSDAPIWAQLSEVADDLLRAGLPLDVLSPKFLDEYGKNNERNRVLLGLFARAVARFGEQLRETNEEGEIPTELPGLLAEMAARNFGLTDNPAMVHKLNLLVTGAGYQTVERFREGIQELKMYALTDIMLNSPDLDRQKWARETIAREFNMGGPPYRLGSPEARLHYNQSMEVVQRALRDNKGFGGLALDCRGVPTSEELEPVLPMITRFGSDSAREVNIANASTNQRYPGKGVHIVGIEPESVFAPDPDWEEGGKSSPFWQWTEGRGLFAGEYFHRFDMEDFRNAEFLLLRGAMAVMNPGNEKFTLDGVNYSYVVFNRHFYPGTETACLVPTEILLDQLSSGLIPLNSYRGFDDSRRDLSEDYLSYSALLMACEERGFNLLNLTYGSVIGGGLCNAYLPCSEPHYQWEDLPAQLNAWKDSWGHVHKSWLLMRDFAPDGFRIDSKLSFARELQQNVYDVSRALQSELDAFRFALSFYKMGNTLRNGGFRDGPGERGQRSEQFMGDRQQEQPEFDEQTVHDYRYRMLEEAYRWHHGAIEAGWNLGQIPVLHFAYVLEPNLLPPKATRMFELDLADMKLVTPDGEFYLPIDSNGNGAEEREIWRKNVIPYFQQGTGYEPRLLMRDGAYSLFE